MTNTIEKASDVVEAVVWQDISSAPKDGTRILLWDGNRKNRYIGFWEIQKHHRNPRPYWDNECAYRDIMYQRTFPPTHWMPLPEAPTTTGEPA